jgi:tetratricopeptide (TPR) repeat protein
MGARENFYVIGGTLQSSAASYVARRADLDLYEGLRAGRFCYVLTSRQMGKSSLMVQTAVRLRAEGVAVAVLDLTAIGQNLTAEQWYDGLLNRVGRQLDLEDELEDFWSDNERLGPLQRWMMAVREVVLKERKGQIVFFVDEIDAVRSLPFSTDEFFAGIREFYNRRTEDPELNRLTFCLLGVATPSDLIRDTRTTPFNVGQRIELTDFTEGEAAPLAAGLGRPEAEGREMIRRVLYWTGGHPYLTQRLCRAVAEDATAAGGGGVDRVCESLFLSARARERDDNLLFVRERILRNEADRAGLLDLYLRVREGKRVADDEADPLVSVLRLSGITRAVGGRLQVRNRIYHRVFDRAWVIGNMPDAELRRQRAAYRRGLVRAATVAAVILLVMSGLGLVALRQRNRALEESRRADTNFRQLQQQQAQLERALAEAQTQRGIAEEQRGRAEEQRAEADRQRQAATEQQQEAERERARAVAARRAAEQQRGIARAQAAVAERERRRALMQTGVAEEARPRAEELSRLSIDTLFNITRFLENSNEQLRAVGYYDQLAQIYRKADRRREEADTLLTIGGVYIKLRQESQANEYFNRSLGVFGGAGEQEEQALTQIKLGDLYRDAGDRAKAAAHYGSAVKLLQDSLAQLRARRDRKREANALYYLSLAHGGLGDARRALDYCRQARPLFQSLGDAVMLDILDIRIEELAQSVREQR